MIIKHINIDTKNIKTKLKKNWKLKTSTYNGVGKTLSIVLIDFCLGSTALDDLKKLNWNFSLTVNINDINYVFKRNTVEHKNISINDEQYTLDKFKKKLEEMLTIERQENVSLRTIISYFIRYKKSSFLDSIITTKYSKSNKPDYRNLVNVFYLLGLDTNLLREKQSNFKNLNLQRTLKRVLKIQK